MHACRERQTESVRVAYTYCSVAKATQLECSFSQTMTGKLTGQKHTRAQAHQVFFLVWFLCIYSSEDKLVIRPIIQVVCVLRR